ncbi:MAG: transporter substrate-binding domain-containing protein, partial [Stenotrophomonas sp.]
MPVPIRRHLGTLIVVTVLAAGVGLILYTRAGAAPDKDNAAPSSLASKPTLHAPPNPAAIALLPKDHVLVTAGALTIATTPSALPLSDYAADGKQVIGVEPDIAKLVADALGLRLNLVPVAWPDWPLGLESGKYDAVMSNITVTESRKRKFDFSSYRYDLLGIYTRTGGPVRAVTQPRDVAGLKVIV